MLTNVLLTFRVGLVFVCRMSLVYVFDESSLKNMVYGTISLILSDLKKQLPCCEIYCHLKPKFLFLLSVVLVESSSQVYFKILCVMLINFLPLIKQIAQFLITPFPSNEGKNKIKHVLFILSQFIYCLTYKGFFPLLQAKHLKTVLVPLTV